MKNIMEWIATPSSTLGMGNPMIPDDTTPGSEGIVPFIKRKLKKKRKLGKPKKSKELE